MRSKRNTHRKRTTRRRRTSKRGNGRGNGKRWVTAIEAAHKTLNATGSLQAARKTLKKQALTNARKLFGSVGNM